MVDQGRRAVGWAEEAVGDIAHHVGGGLVLNVLQPGAGLFIAFGQERDGPGIAEEMIVLVEPDRRWREAEAGDEGELDGLGALGSFDLDRLADGDAGMAHGQEVDALATRRDQRLDIALAGEPWAAIAVV